MAADLQTFRERFPLLAEAPDGAVLDALAVPSLSADLFGDQMDRATLLAAAHELTLNGHGEEGNLVTQRSAGVTSARSGDASLNFAPTEASASLYERTSYGQRLLALATSLGGGPRAVGGFYG